MRIAFLLTQRKEQVLLRKHQWRTPLVSDLRFDALTSQAIHLAEFLSDATEPIPVNWMRVHLTAEAEYGGFHNSDPSPQADEDICILNDTLEAMLVDDPVTDHQGLCDTQSAAQPHLTSESVPMVDREIFMRDTNPVCLTTEVF